MPFGVLKGPITRLVTTHQAATACGIPFHLLLADSNQPHPPRPSIDQTPPHTQAEVRTYGLAHNVSSGDVDDIATIIDTLNGGTGGDLAHRTRSAGQAEPSRQPAQSR